MRMAAPRGKGVPSPLPRPAPLLLTQAADGAVVGLVAQGVGTRVAEAKVPAGQDEGVPQVREAHHTLVAIVTVLIITGLQRRERETENSLDVPVAQLSIQNPRCTAEIQGPLSGL